MNDLKAKAILLGETAGEKCALKLFEKGGLGSVAETLIDGAETWRPDAKAQNLAQKADVDEDYRYAFYDVFARGARRVAEALVRGESDGVNGRKFGDGIATFANCRDSVKAVYGEAYARGAAAREGSDSVSIGVPAIDVSVRSAI